jgi:uncharacterized membrane protein YgaE (UPF0421/DUF939 family)
MRGIIMKLKKYKIGMRTIKTGIAVAIGLFIAELLGLNSHLFVGIGAISTMQASVSESFVNGKNRMLATVMGALVAVLIEFLFPHNVIFLGLGIIIVIQILNILGWKNSIALAGIVFIAVSLNTDIAIIPSAFNRTLDTFVGIVVGVLVNYFIATPNIDKLFSLFRDEFLLKAKDYSYKLTVAKSVVDIVSLREDLVELEKLQVLIENDTKINIAKNKERIQSTITIHKMQDIYSSLSSLEIMKHIAILSPANLNLIEEVYDIQCFWSEKAIISEEDIIFNYHLQRVLKDLLLFKKEKYGEL